MANVTNNEGNCDIVSVTHIHLVSIKYVVKLSTQMSNCLPCPDVCMLLSIVMQKKDIIDWQNFVPSHNHLFSSMKEGLRGKRYVSDEEVKSAVMKWLKEQSAEFYKAGIHTLIQRGRGVLVV